MSERDANQGDDHVREGLAASQRGDGEGAIRALREAVATQPGAAVPRFLLGAELAQLGDLISAESEYANAVLLDPSFDMARFQLGLLQFTSGRAAVALVTWSTLIEQPRSSSLQRFASGFAALARDDLPEAMQCFRDGQDLVPRNDALNADIRMVMARIQRVMDTQPSPDSSRRVAATGEDGEAHVLLANYEFQGRAH